VRTYGQFCALAKALDVLGDRWSLLIVRELMVCGPSRYTDIRRGLPGIATNLLADRLRELEDAGVVRRFEAKPPVATTLFELTPRGQELRDVMLALGRWGAPMLLEASDQEEFQTHWLTLPLSLRLADHAPDQPPIAIQVLTGDEPLAIEAGAGEVRVRVGSLERPDAVLEGSHRVVVNLLAGRLDLDRAIAAGARYDGDPRIIARVQPAALSATI
jgi:DNA-binding HxlR family transcriptional regulator